MTAYAPFVVFLYCSLNLALHLHVGPSAPSHGSYLQQEVLYGTQRIPAAGSEDRHGNPGTEKCASPRTTLEYVHAIPAFLEGATLCPLLRRPDSCKGSRQ